MREYESIFVLEPEATDADVDVEIEKIRDIVTEGSGEIIEVQKWGRRKLAYEIKKKSEGLYTLVRFQAGNDSLTELNRRFRMNEALLRHLVVEYEGPFPGELTEMPSPYGEERAEGKEEGSGTKAPEEVAAVAKAPVAKVPAAEGSASPVSEAAPTAAATAAPTVAAEPEAQAEPATEATADAEATSEPDPKTDPKPEAEGSTEKEASAPDQE